MIEETGTIWVVKFQTKEDNEKAEIQEKRCAEDIHTAFEISREHLEKENPHFYKLRISNCYILSDDNNNRVTIREKEVYAQR